MTDRRRRDSAAVTWVLTAVLAVSGSRLALAGGGAPLDVALPWAPVGLAALFALAESTYVSVEHRRQTYSCTMAGVPLVLGLLVCPTWQVVLARAAATAGVLLLQRLPAMKTAYNLAAYAFETALAGALLHGLWPGGERVVSLRAGVAVVVVLALVDALMSLLVLLLIRAHGNPVGRPELVEALAPTAVLSAFASMYALVSVVLLLAGPLGWALLAGLTTGGAAAYRTHSVLTARHASLEQVSTFVEQDEDADSVEELAGRRVARVRGLLNAGRAQVLLPQPDGDDLLLLTVDEQDRLSVSTVARDDLDAVHARACTAEEAVVVPRGTKDPGLRAWLAARGARDAVVVPLPRGEGRCGALTVTDRLSDAATFTPDDLTMLRALAGHLGVALQSTALLLRLAHEATHDPLTGLPNRALLQDRLAAALSVEDGPSVALLMLDLDRFKEVNDTLGHDCGDHLLRVVAERLTAATPPGAVVTRLGGDEFAVLLTGLPPDGCGAERVALAAREALRVPVTLDGVQLPVEASIGIAAARPAGPAGADAAGRDLLRHADTAMYAAKGGRLPYAVWSEEMDRGRVERLALLADLRLALRRDELVLVFQPKVDLRTRRVTGVEALVRWQHPRAGLLAPDVFIPLAEQTDLIEPLTAQVLALALRACRGWQQQGLDLTVAVNLSTRNLADPALPGRVAAALRTAGLTPAHLVLEITESAVMADPDTAVPLLAELAAAGITLSLDDFGTGYSSLAYLQRLPVQEVKIDRSFVQGLSPGADRSAEVLVRSIVDLGAAFGLHVVAEGVEDAAALARLTQLGCDSAQGYHLSRPVPGEALPEVVRRLDQTLRAPAGQLAGRS